MRQKLSLISIERPAYISSSATFSYHKNILIGRYCRIGHECHIDGEGGVKIGDGTIFGPRVIVLSSSHDYAQEQLLPYGFNDKKAEVIIGKGCWIGWGVLICPGVKIGNGSIVAMGSVVSKDVPDGALVGGNPAKIIKEAHSRDMINKAIQEDGYFLKEIFINGRRRENKNDNYNINLLS